MNNATLRSLTVENYAPFARRVEFNTIADASKNEHIENTFKKGDDNYNRVSYIYGANGSGKTFFCKAIREIQRWLEWSPLSLAPSKLRAAALQQFPDFNKPVPTFAFDEAYGNQPTTFAVEVVIDETIYRYEFAVQNQKVVKESLTKKYRRTEKLLTRTSPSCKDISVRSEMKSFESNVGIVREEALCLAMAATHNNVLAERIVDAITSITAVNMTAPRISPLPDPEAFSSERMAIYTSILRSADPTLKRIDAKFENEEVPLLKETGDGFENRQFVATKTTVAIATTHTVVRDGAEVNVAAPIDFFSDESLGTVKLFTVLPHIFNALETGGTLIVDEIENGMHLSLVREIVQLFTNPESNPLGAQLICTSHQPLLINDNIRRDQVWVVSKDEHGKSRFHRMSEQGGTRAGTNLANRILQGALGCNPDQFFKK
jgi:AAA15 family ATPase/GTPase